MLKSISVKIFGFSVILLILMVGAAILSANESKAVHRSLRTLELSMFPLAGTVAKINLVVQSQKTTANFLLITPDAKAADRCLKSAKSDIQNVDNLLLKAQKYRLVGSKIAITERVRIAMARFEILIDNLVHQEKRLSAMTLAACRLDANEASMSEALIQAGEVERLSNILDTEIDSFVFTSSRQIVDDQQRSEQTNFVMIGTAAMVGLMLAWLVSRGITRPILRLLAGTRAVGAGLLDEAYVHVTSKDEIGDVTNAFNAMLIELREKEHIKETFGQYVDPRIVTGLLNGAQHSSRGEKQIATLFFSDIVSFSAIAERLAPSTLVDLMNAYFSEMSQPIRENFGIIDKYIGDSIMAFWVPPFVDVTQQAALACKAALDQRELLDAFRSRVPDLTGLRRDVPFIDFRVGISTGEVVVGSVGSDTARSFTVMGDSVNQASRLEGANKNYGTRLLIDHDTFILAATTIEVREIDTITVMGRLEPMAVYELVATAGNLSPVVEKMFERYAEGLYHYRKADWAKAEHALRGALEIVPGDGPSTAMLSRIKIFHKEPPTEWAGIWHNTSK